MFWLQWGAIRKKLPGVVNRTKPNQKPIEPNRIQSFSWSSIAWAIQHNWTGTFLWVWLSSIYWTQSNPTEAIGSILFGGKTKWYTKIDKHSLSVELEGFHSLAHVVNDQAGHGHCPLPSEWDPYLLFSVWQQIYPWHGQWKSTCSSPLPPPSKIVSFTFSALLDILPVLLAFEIEANK